jgi:hypothetical protein
VTGLPAVWRGGDAAALEKLPPIVHAELHQPAAFDSRKARVVELRFFAGPTVDETAEALHVSEDTVVRDWKMARSWLAHERRG